MAVLGLEIRARAGPPLNGLATPAKRRRSPIVATQVTKRHAPEVTANTNREPNQPGVRVRLDTLAPRALEGIESIK
jgi:hypothetical protein